jgi:glucosamine--fructose-6-phosphate aminotransferase (isomerizing)
MCGIIGIIGKEAVTPRLIQSLKRLEYRGYDSAGVAAIVDGRIDRRRAAGKIANLESVLAENPLHGVTGIGHTRWATHGGPTTPNAHPHATDRVAIVHNGIIENFRSLREELISLGHMFQSETDSEVIAHLITEGLNNQMTPRAAAAAAIARLEGAFAIACLFAGEEKLLVGARKGAPLVVGVGHDGEMYLGSDAIAVAPLTSNVIYFEEGDVAYLTDTDVTVTDAAGAAVKRPIAVLSASVAMVEKGAYQYFMQKEIFEQPETISRTVARYVNAYDETIALGPELGIALKDTAAVSIVACGTAHFAGRVGEYWLEQVARIPAECDIASEFRYRSPVSAPGAAAMFVSQSGETADTLAALRRCKELGLKTLSVLNVEGSTMWRETDAVLPTLAGPEIGVASTKAFTAQLSAIAALAIAIARARGAIDSAHEKALVRHLIEAPRLVTQALLSEPSILKIADDLSHARDVMYLARGAHYPLALEGALKLKEISYIHAEGYAAGELKHGPIALIDERTPSVVIAPHDHLFEKTMSNVQEVAARGGKVILISDAAGHAASAGMALSRIEAPACDPFIAPIVYAIPLQLLAYHTAVRKGTDVDQPRNLAKSVTVE